MASKLCELCRSLWARIVSAVFKGLHTWVCKQLLSEADTAILAGPVRWSGREGCMAAKAAKQGFDAWSSAIPAMCGALHSKLCSCLNCAQLCMP